MGLTQKKWGPQQSTFSDEYRARVPSLVLEISVNTYILISFTNTVVLSKHAVFVASFIQSTVHASTVRVIYYIQQYNTLYSCKNYCENQ